MDYLNLIQGVLAVALVVVVGFLGVQQGVVKGLRDANTDLRSRDADREKQIRTSTERVAELETAVKVLTATVTGEAHLVALADRLEDHHKESIAALGAIQQELRK